MKKLLLGLFFFVATFLIVPVQVSAETAQTTATTSTMHISPNLRHAYKPFRTMDNNWTQARVNNVTKVSPSNLVCVNAFNASSNVHLGCLNINWGEIPIQNGYQGAEFSVPTNTLGSGTYQIKYTYLGADKVWHEIGSMDGKALYGNYP